VTIFAPKKTMLRNPKLVHWQAVGKRRFAESGINGIHIDDMSKEIGVAKTSFYFFFNSKQEYLNQLFAFWELEGTDRLYAMVNHIEDPVKRFLALGRLIEENIENEHFYFQLKLYAKHNKHAVKFLESVDEKRRNIAVKIFKDAGQSPEDIEKHRAFMSVFYMGRIALTMGYNSESACYEPTQDELLRLFGFKK